VSIEKAIIPATPKVAKPPIQYIVEEAVASGIEDIIIVKGKGKKHLKITLIS